MIWRLTVCIVFLFLNAAAYAAQPSFDCAKATTPVEKLICGDDELSSLDAELQTAFRAAYKSTDLKQALLAGQRQWLSARSFCGSFDGGEDPLPRRACLRGRYERRLAFLHRNPILASTRVCHAFAEAISFADGYIGVTHDATPDGVLGLAANDALGAITLDMDGFSEWGVKKNLSAENLKLMNQIKKLDTEVTGFRRDYYRIGPQSNQLAISSYTQGTAYCQVFHAYRIAADATLKEVSVPADSDNDCRGDYTYFGQAPSGGKEESPAFAHITPDIAKDVISVGIWSGSALGPICRMTAAYDVKLMLSAKACRDRSQCGDLEKRATDLAISFDKLHRDTSEPKAGEALVGTKSAEVPNYDDRFLKVEPSWFKEGFNDDDQLESFGLEAASYELIDSHIVLRISHGYHFDFSSDGYILQAYDNSDGALTPIAAFQIDKVRSRLRGPIEVNDNIPAMREAR